MARRVALDLAPAVHRRSGASGYDPNVNGTGSSVGPGPTQRYAGGGPVFGLANFQPVASAWSGWRDDWGGTPMEVLGAQDMPYDGDWSGFGYGRQTEGGYLKRVSIVGTCVDLNTRQLASFPVYGVRGYQPVALPVWSANPEPSLYADWSEFVKQLVNSFQLAGEAILWAVDRYANGFPSRFVVLNPYRVKIEMDEGRLVYTLDGDVLAPADVCHIKFESLPGNLRGISPLQWVGRNLVSAATLEKYSTDIALHGLWAVLKNPANLTALQRDDAKRSWLGARAQMPAAPAVLSGGWDLDVLNLSPKDMALLDLKVFDEQRIAAAFGVPPYLVALDQPGGLTYTNATSLFDHHWRATLRPMVQSIANAMSEWLLPRGTRMEFNRDEYVRPGLGERAQAYAALHGIEDADGNRAIEVDEVRIAERFVPHDLTNVPSGDVFIGATP